MNATPGGRAATGPGEEAERRSSVRFPLILAPIVCAGLWVIPLSRSSLWLDETGTYWTARDGFVDTIHRSFMFEGQTPLYYLVSWTSIHLGGPRELMARMPSVIFAAGALVIVFALGRRLLDSEAGVYAAVVFATTPWVVVEAAEARPYALALLLECASILALIVWMRSKRPRDGITYVALTVLMLYADYLFVSVLIIHALYLLLERRRGSIGTRHIVAVAAGVLIFMIPFVPQLRSLAMQSGDRAVPVAFPGIMDLVLGYAPLTLIVAVLAGKLLYRVSDAPRERTPSLGGAARGLVIALALVPPLLSIGVTALTTAHLLTPRYLIPAAPGVALVAAWSFRTIPAARTRRMTVAALAIGSAVAFTLSWRANHFGQQEDWRAAVALINTRVTTSTPVLVDSGLIESRRIDWLRDPAWRGFILAPISTYPIRGPVRPLPYQLEPSADGYLLDLMKTALDPSDRFYLLVPSQVEPGFRDYFDTRMGPKGFSSHVLDRLRGVSVLEFFRRT